MKGRGAIDPQLVLWNASTGKQQWSVTTELHELRSIAFSPDGALLASGHEFHGLAFVGLSKQRIVAHARWSHIDGHCRRLRT